MSERAGGTDPVIEGARVRAATLADASAVAALVRAAFATQVGLVDPPPSALSVDAETIAAQISSGGGFVVEQDGAILASCLFARHPVEADGALHIARLAVDPSHRRRGLAKALLARIAREASERGLSRLTLSTRLALESNRRLFESAGFREIARHAHPGHAEPTFMDMEMRLDPHAP